MNLETVTRGLCTALKEQGADVETADFGEGKVLVHFEGARTVVTVAIDSVEELPPVFSAGDVVRLKSHPKGPRMTVEGVEEDGGIKVCWFTPADGGPQRDSVSAALLEFALWEEALPTKPFAVGDIVRTTNGDENELDREVLETRDDLVHVRWFAANSEVRDAWFGSNDLAKRPVPPIAEPSRGETLTEQPDPPFVGETATQTEAQPYGNEGEDPQPAGEGVGQPAPVADAGAGEVDEDPTQG